MKAVEELFSTISLQTNAFANATGLHCKSCCGKCCDNPRIETTVTEMLPAAQHLVSNHQAESMVIQLEALHSKNPTAENVCVFYHADASNPGNGHCALYDYCPGICRLFGYAMKKDIKERKQLVTCRVMKEETPEDCQKAQQHIENGGAVINTGNHAMMAYAIDPIRGRELMPINKALRTALEHIIAGDTNYS